MTLPRQNSAWVDVDGRPTRDLYNWARGVSSPIQESAAHQEVSLKGLSDVRVTGISDGDGLVWDNSSGKWVNSPSALDSSTSSLSASVQLTVSGTWYDGPSVSLGAGTWLITATASFSRSSNILTSWEARLFDGTIVLASSGVTTPALVNFTANASLSAVVTLSSAGTIKLQATTNAGATACLLLATTAVNGLAKATVINAVRIA